MKGISSLMVLGFLSVILLVPGMVGAAPPIGPINDIINQLNDIEDQIAHLPPTWSQTFQCDTTACPRFELVMSGAAVLDRETGLVWEQSPSTDTFTWFNAHVHCNDLTTGGRLGWRLPTVQESASPVDPSVAFPGPTLPAGHPFSNVQSSFYWSATTYANDASFAWGVNFGTGSVSIAGKGGGFYVWCVRGGHGVDPQ